MSAFTSGTTTAGTWTPDCSASVLGGEPRDVTVQY